MAAKSDIDKVCHAARAQGWRVESTSRGHIRLIPIDKDKPIVVSSGTPSDHRSIKNFLAQARRSGLVWPCPKGVTA